MWGGGGVRRRCRAFGPFHRRTGAVCLSVLNLQPSTQESTFSMVQNNPMDMVIGAGEAAGREGVGEAFGGARAAEARGERQEAVAELRCAVAAAPGTRRRCSSWRTGWTMGGGRG